MSKQIAVGESNACHARFSTIVGSTDFTSATWQPCHHPTGRYGKLPRRVPLIDTATIFSLQLQVQQDPHIAQKENQINAVPLPTDPSAANSRWISLSLPPEGALREYLE